MAHMEGAAVVLHEDLNDVSIDPKHCQLTRIVRSGLTQFSIYDTQLRGTRVYAWIVPLSPHHRPHGDHLTRMMREYYSKFEQLRNVSARSPNLCPLYHCFSLPPQLNGVHANAPFSMGVITAFLGETFVPVDEYISFHPRPEEIPLSRRRLWAYSIAEAIFALHRNGQYHGSLSPETVCICNGGAVYVTEYWNQGLPIDAVNNSRTGIFIAPEVHASNGAIEAMSPAADVWAWGMLYYYLLTKKMPFYEAFTRSSTAGPSSRSTQFTCWTSAYTLIRQMVEDTQFRPFFPSTMDPNDVSIISQCLEANPRRRIPMKTVIRHMETACAYVRVQCPTAPAATVQQPRSAPILGAAKSSSAPTGTAGPSGSSSGGGNSYGGAALQQRADTLAPVVNFANPDERTPPHPERPEPAPEAPEHPQSDSSTKKSNSNTPPANPTETRECDQNGNVGGTDARAASARGGAVTSSGANLGGASGAGGSSSSGMPVRAVRQRSSSLSGAQPPRASPFASAPGMAMISPAARPMPVNCLDSCGSQNANSGVRGPTLRERSISLSSASKVLNLGSPAKKRAPTSLARAGRPNGIKSDGEQSDLSNHSGGSASTPSPGETKAAEGQNSGTSTPTTNDTRLRRIAGIRNSDLERNPCDVGRRSMESSNDADDDRGHDSDNSSNSSAAARARREKAPAECAFSQQPLGLRGVAIHNASVARKTVSDVGVEHNYAGPTSSSSSGSSGGSVEALMDPQLSCTKPPRGNSGPSRSGSAALTEAETVSRPLFPASPKTSDSNDDVMLQRVADSRQGLRDVGNARSREAQGGNYNLLRERQSPSLRSPSPGTPRGTIIITRDRFPGQSPFALGACAPARMTVQVTAGESWESVVETCFEIMPITGKCDDYRLFRSNSVMMRMHESVEEVHFDNAFTLRLMVDDPQTTIFDSQFSVASAASYPFSEDHTATHPTSPGDHDHENSTSKSSKNA